MTPLALYQLALREAAQTLARTLKALETEIETKRVGAGDTSIAPTQAEIDTYSEQAQEAINTCAYTTEILHGAIRAVPAGEVEAARALGMGRWQAFRRIVLPSS